MLSFSFKPLNKVNKSLSTNFIYLFSVKRANEVGTNNLTLHYLCTLNVAKLIEMVETIVITMLIVAISVALLAIKMILQKNGKFPNSHVSGNKAMRERGIGCVQSQDRSARMKSPLAVEEKEKRTNK